MGTASRGNVAYRTTVIAIIVCTIAAALYWDYRRSGRSASAYVACSVQVEALANDYVLASYGMATRVYPIGPNAELDKSIRTELQDKMIWAQDTLLFPDGARNFGLFDFSSELYLADCPRGGGEVRVNLIPTMGRENNTDSWSWLRSEAIEGGYTLRTEHMNGDYIEVVTRYPELKYLFETEDIEIPHVTHAVLDHGDPDDIRGDAGTDRIAARFRWSTLKTREEVFTALAGVLDMKWQMEGAQGQAAIFIDTKEPFVTSSITYQEEPPTIVVDGLDAATNGSESVSGVLYWR